MAKWQNSSFLIPHSEYPLTVCTHLKQGASNLQASKHPKTTPTLSVYFAGLAKRSGHSGISTSSAFYFPIATIASIVSIRAITQTTLQTTPIEPIESQLSNPNSQKFPKTHHPNSCNPKKYFVTLQKKSSKFKV